MSRRRSPTLTEAELRLMRVIWDKGQATVGEVVEALADGHSPAYNTVLTILRILEKKGYLNHHKEGRAHVFSPLVTRGQARRQALTQMVRSFFDNSPALLLHSLLQDEGLSGAERSKLAAMIREREAEARRTEERKTRTRR